MGCKGFVPSQILPILWHVSDLPLCNAASYPTKNDEDKPVPTICNPQWISFLEKVRFAFLQACFLRSLRSLLDMVLFFGSRESTRGDRTF